MQRLGLAVGAALAAVLLFPAFCSGQTISIVSGNGQLVCVDCPLAPGHFASLIVQVNNAAGAPMADTAVTWKDTEPDGITVVTAMSSTGANGQATFTLGPQNLPLGTAGNAFPFTVTASALGATVSFAETAATPIQGGFLAPINVALVSTAATPPLTGIAGTTAAQPIVVSVTTSVSGPLGIVTTPLPGVAVSLQPAKGGPSVSCATEAGQAPGTVLTGSNGQASCTPVFGSAPGTGTYTISVGVNFQTLSAGNLTVTAGPPAVLKIISGNNQTVNAGARTPVALLAQVTDTAGNPSDDAAVVWSVTSGTATLSNVVNSSSSTGQVSAFVTPTVGPVQVTVALSSNKSIQAVFNVNVNVIITTLQVVSGNNQQAVAGAVFTDPLIVQVNDNGAAVPGAAVTFAVSSGSATLSPDSAAAGTVCANPATSCTVTTGVNGQAPVLAMAGATSGPVVVTASVTSSSKTYSQPFNLTVAPPFQITAVVNAAGFEYAPLAASPCSLVTIYGTGLANDLQGVVVPFIAPQTQVAGVSVQFGGVAAPILYVANLNGTQSVSAQVPCEVPSSTAVPPATVPMVVTVNGQAFPSFPVPITPISPGIFQFVDSDGQTRAVLVNQDGSFISVSNPARPGDIVRMFVTGLGQTTPALFTDEFEPLIDQNGTWVPQDLKVNVSMVVGVNNNGVLVLSAKYAWDMVGVYEVDFQVPANTTLSNNAPFAIAVYQNNNTTLQFANPSLIPIQ